MTRFGTVHDVAPGLLGAVVSTWVAGEFVAVRVTEVEAYDGADDPASHAFRGETPRCASMFLEGGHVYVYRHMGLHHCMNVVCGPAGLGTGVLLRSGEVIDGVDVALRRRQAAGVCRTMRDLARGPGRLTVALGVDRANFDGVRLVEGTASEEHPIGLEWPSTPTSKLRRGPRIGVPVAGRDPERFSWRYWLDDGFVSG